MADAVFFPYLAFFVRLGLKLDDRYPNLKGYYERLKDRPSIQKTWPPHWKASPPTSDLLKVI
jgi:glutathione S-transferase